MDHLSIIQNKIQKIWRQQIGLTGTLILSLDHHPKATFFLGEPETRRERLKSAPYLRPKKRKTFFGKKLKFLKFFFFQKSHIVPENVKGDPFEFINIHSVAKYQKTRRRDPLGTLKNF